jgi:hypothetical protein
MFVTTVSASAFAVACFAFSRALLILEAILAAGNKAGVKGSGAPPILLEPLCASAGATSRSMRVNRRLKSKVRISDNGLKLNADVVLQPISHIGNDTAAK